MKVTSRLEYAKIHKNSIRLVYTLKADFRIAIMTRIKKIH